MVIEGEVWWLGGRNGDLGPFRRCDGIFKGHAAHIGAMHSWSFGRILAMTERG